MKSFYTSLLTFVIVVLLSSSLVSTYGTSPISNITIKSNQDFITCQCVSAGDGSISKPYLISGLTLNSHNAPGILVDNTVGQMTKYFVISGDIVNGGKSGFTTYPGIEFVNVNGLGKILGSGNTVNGNQYGILLYNSYNIVIDGSGGSSFNNNGADGIAIVGGGYNTISNIIANHNGLVITEDLFGGGVGIRLNSTFSNTIQNVVLSSDAFAGLALFGSSNNLLSGISVHYPDFYGAVIDGGKANKLSGSALQTADYVGLWLRHSTSDNQILSNNISSNGPPGHEIKAGIVPYFSSGIYLSSGTSNNLIKNNVLHTNFYSGDIVQDNSNIINGLVKPIQINNLFNDPISGNEPSSPVFPSGPAGNGNTFCGNSLKTSQGVTANPAC